MASAFSHAITAYAIGRGMSMRESLKFWLLGITCAVLPDADVIGFRLGIPYGHPFGHRGFTHSFLFALLLALFVVKVFCGQHNFFSREGLLLLVYFFLATASHGILDALTNGGLGVEFFYPFSTHRYFFPFRPVQVSPLDAGSFFSRRGIAILKSEFIWIWIPSLAVILFSFLVRRKKREGLSGNTN